MSVVDVSALSKEVERATVEQAATLYVAFSQLAAQAQARVLLSWQRAPAVLRDADDEWLRPAEAAALLKVSVKWLARRRHRLPFIRPLERGFRVSRRGLREHMARQTPLWANTE